MTVKNISDFNSGDEIHGDFVPPPEKSLVESIEEARQLSHELHALQERLYEHFNFVFAHMEGHSHKKAVPPS